MRELARERNRMRCIDDDEFAQGLWIRYGIAPGERTTPIVRHQHEFLMPQMSRELTHILDQHARLVLLHLRRAVGKVVAAQVGRNREMIAAEMFQLLFPAVPELGKAVQKQDQRSLSGVGVMQAHAVHTGVVVAYLGQI